MPELPEVETIRKGLEKLALGKRISGVEVLSTRSVRHKPDLFKKKLTGSRFVSMKRKGKVLIIETSSRYFVLARLGMTGQITVGTNQTPTNHTRVIIHFEDGSSLFYNDIRKFGYLLLATPEEKNSFLENIGIDPLSDKFSLEYLKDSLLKRKSSLKAFLLDQSLISGIGNIYADEISFDAGLRPDRNVGTLDDSEIKKLYNSIVKIINLGVEKRGTTFSNYVDAKGKKGRFQDFLKVYGKKEGSKCPDCEGVIRKITVAGRTTKFCELCQK